MGKGFLRELEETVRGELEELDQEELKVREGYSKRIKNIEEKRKRKEEQLVKVEECIKEELEKYFK